MHVISRKRLSDFWQKHPDSQSALQAWFYEAKNAEWRNSAEIKARYASASIINHERIVFNIAHNKYRLVVRINYDSFTVFIRFVGTHKAYDRINVETI